jgi:SNF2 family DNA or RNA helicase
MTSLADEMGMGKTIQTISISSPRASLRLRRSLPLSSSASQN